MALSTLPVGLGLSSLLLGYFATPFGCLFPWPSPADTVIGWRQFAADVEQQRQQSGAAWIATTDYGVNGEIAFNARDVENVQAIVERQRYFFEHPLPELIGKPALLVVRTSEGRLLACPFGLAASRWNRPHPAEKVTV